MCRRTDAESGAVLLFLRLRYPIVGRQTAYELRPPGETFGAPLQMTEFFRCKQEVVTCGNSKKPLKGNMIFHGAGMVAFLKSNPCRTIRIFLVNIRPIQIAHFVSLTVVLFAQFRCNLIHREHRVSHFYD